jgi:hypothetical protein
MSPKDPKLIGLKNTFGLDINFVEFTLPAGKFLSTTFDLTITSCDS